MKTFDEICDELQNQNNNELNQLWKEAKKEKNKANKIAFTICLIIDLLALMMGLIFLIIPILILNIFVVIIVNLVFSKNTSSYNIKYKEIVINKLMNNFYDNLEYFPRKEMPEYVYRQCRYEHYDKYRSEDYFEALINSKNSIQMAEIHTQEEEEYKDSEGKIQKRLITKFHGLFAKIELDKSINEELKIMKNGSAFLRSNQLKMDSSEFEKYFDVVCSNKILGMQLLTADVMQELVEFENNTRMKFDIIINNNELYLRFHSGNMFEPTSLKNGPIDKKSLQKYFYMLNFTYNLSNKLIKLVNETEI